MLSGEVVGSLSLGVFGGRLDVVLMDMVWWEVLVVGECLDWMVLGAFSSLGRSMISYMKGALRKIKLLLYTMREKEKQ